MRLLLRVDHLYSMLIVKNAKNKILWQHQNLHSKQRQDMRHMWDTVMVKRKIPVAENLRCIRNWLERNFGQN